MHGIFLNVVTQLMTYWFSENFSDKSFSLWKHTTKVNKMMQSLKTPHSGPVFPSLKNLTQWKAAQYR